MGYRLMTKKNPLTTADGGVLYKKEILQFGVEIWIIELFNSIAYLKENHLIQNWSVQIDHDSGARVQPRVQVHLNRAFLAEANHDDNLQILL